VINVNVTLNDSTGEPCSVFLFNLIPKIDLLSTTNFEVLIADNLRLFEIDETG